MAWIKQEPVDYSESDQSAETSSIEVTNPLTINMKREQIANNLNRTINKFVSRPRSLSGDFQFNEQKKIRHRKCNDLIRKQNFIVEQIEINDLQNDEIIVPNAESEASIVHHNEQNDIPIQLAMAVVENQSIEESSNPNQNELNLEVEAAVDPTYCGICEQKFKTRQTMRKHLTSLKHRKQLNIQQQQQQQPQHQRPVVNVDQHFNPLAAINEFIEEIDDFIENNVSSPNVSIEFI